jgi:cytidylate kinase
MHNLIITINRECGSGGGEIAHLLGEKLGIKVYDRSMLSSIEKQFNMTLENIEQVKAQKTSWWSDFCRFYQQFAAASYPLNDQTEVTPLSIYHAEARVLRELAEQESCIIIGRAGFHIFRDNPNAIHMLIMADRDTRITRIAQKQNLTPDEAATVIDKVDKARDTFVKNVTDTSRYDARNYDFVFNVTGMQPEVVASFLADNIRLMATSR